VGRCSFCVVEEVGRCERFLSVEHGCVAALMAHCCAR